MRDKLIARKQVLCGSYQLCREVLITLLTSRVGTIAMRWKTEAAVTIVGYNFYTVTTVIATVVSDIFL